MAKREFMQLAHKYEPHKHWISGWMLSEKLDGLRCFWDGGITTGIWADEIPWANVEKDYRLKNRPKATGLWSRYGKVIHAPDAWLERLPGIFLDGELFIERGSWQILSSIVKKHVGDSFLWNNVKFMTLDVPNPHAIFANGIINTTNFKKTFNGISEWFNNNGFKAEAFKNNLGFEFVYDNLKNKLLENSNFKIHEQISIPLKDPLDFVNSKLDEIVAKGGEGVIIRNPTSIWTPERTHNLLKYKPFNDDEGTVVNYVWGRKTELGSKLLGKMGALVLDYKGKRLELSGFTDEEREMTGPGNALEEGTRCPGEEITDHRFFNPTFPRGSKVTFRYRELSDSGIPKEARYIRDMR